MMSNTQADLTALSKLRKHLHQHPELSGKEKATARHIQTFIASYQPQQIITDIGGHGLAAIFDSGHHGPVLLFRSELDALPIQEINQFDYASVSQGVGHKCGHDGHMTMVAALAQFLQAHPPKKGKVILAFQSAEETGQGAEWFVKDPAFEQLRPDYSFALHNLPGYDKHQIILRNGHFSSASKGLTIKLHGKTSHAAEPENGLNPARAVAQILNRWLDLPSEKAYNDFVLLTIIHTSIGEIAFGTSAGEAEIRATLRAYRNDDMEKLTEKAQQEAAAIAKQQGLDISFDEQEVFYALPNNNELHQIVNKLAQAQGLSVMNKETPFRWSEDFSWFAMQNPAYMFGLGAGLQHPQLHNPDYDFPEAILGTGISMYQAICKHFLY